MNEFKYHSGPITSMEWSPHNRSILAASSDDNQLTLWNKDPKKADLTKNDPEFPCQLIFTHIGQDDIKELHWHAQLPGVVLSAAYNEFNILRAVNV